MFNKLRGQFALDAQAAKERQANAMGRDDRVSMQPEDTSEHGSEHKDNTNETNKDIELDI